MSERLMAEFPPVSTEQWMEVVVKDLKGQPYEKRLVHEAEPGVTVKPIYRKEDLPSEMPAARGRSQDGIRWGMREEIRESDPKNANAHALRCLMSGAEELAWHTYPIGSFVKNASALEELTTGIYLEMAPIHWMSGPLSPSLVRLFAAEVERRGISRDEVRGSIDLDPITDAAAGWVNPESDWKGVLVDTLGFIGKTLPSYTTFVVRGSLIEKAGASMAQEVGWAAAIFADSLSAVQEALADGRLFWPSPKPLADIAARSEVRLGVGTQYLLEIAKIRAARIVLANVAAGFGLEGVVPRIHGITTSSTKTLYDPHNNILRGTIEGMAAVIGGCDSLSVAAFDQGHTTPDEFSAHIARNTEILLKEEAHLDKVADPLGGSYAIESLTHSIAEAAWTVFLRAQEAGGFLAGWQSGALPAELERVKKAKADAASWRRTPLVGTSVFPNLKETRLADVSPLPKAKVCRPGVAESLDTLVTDQEAEMGALSPLKLAAPFERLRLAVERSGRRPKVVLLKSGDLAMRSARASFCLGFFGCGGLDVEETVWDGSSLPAADLIVLCSSDAEYLEFTQQVAGLGPSSPVWIAGKPAEGLDELKAAGAADFVHIRLNPVETLEALLPQLGVTL